MRKRTKQTEAERKQDRAGKGTLLERQISVRCKCRYEAALVYFFWLLPFVWGRSPTQWPKRDEAICHFLECLWSEGEAKSRAADRISGLQWKYGIRGVFPGVWRRYKTWNSLEVAAQTPPLPVEAVFALHGLALRSGKPYLAVLLCVGFHCFLRTRFVCTCLKCAAGTTQ